MSGATIAKPPELTPEQKEAVKKTVLNNLRQLAAAADQYYLEYGATTTELTRLVGSGPDRYIRELKPVDGEDYSKIELKVGQPLKVKTRSGIEVEYKN